MNIFLVHKRYEEESRKDVYKESCSQIDTETTKGMCIDDGRNTVVHLHGELTQFLLL